MISPTGLLALYGGALILASLAGGWLLLLLRPSHARLQIGISFVAGLMLGIALLHFLPDAVEHLQSVNRTVSWVLGGFLAMFFLQRFCHYHHHDSPEGDPEDCCHGDTHGDDTGPHAHTLADKSAMKLSWVGTALGLTLHSLVDGLALAAAVTASPSRWAGLGVALVIILHKPFDAMSVSALMAAGGRSRLSRHLINLLFAMVTPLGALLFHLGAEPLVTHQTTCVGLALAFCAGTFLCISCSDLLPELQFHSHDRWPLSAALLAGLSLAILIKQLGA